MVEIAGAGELDASSAGGGKPAERSATSFEDVAGRQRFTIELRPGETTIVSWKKLLKDKPNGAGDGSGAKSVESPPVNSSNPQSSAHLPHPSLDARFPPGQLGENEGKDVAQPPNRLNTVIERIERLYVGKASSDEEDLNDVFPDDDEYDTEDSFIDDTELDDYFQVDNSAIKHDGFFVNRGKLERIEPSQLPNEQPKKRRRKDLSKSLDGSESVQNPNKIPKVGKRPGKAVSLVDRNAHSNTPVIALPNVHAVDARIRNQMNATEISQRKKSSDTKTGGKPVLGVTNGDIIVPEKGIDLQKSGVLPANNNGKLLGSVGGMDQCIQHRESVNVREKSEVHISDNKNSTPNMKAQIVQKKEGSNVRPKSTMLDKAIRDLEKLVAESRPPTTEVQDADNSSQGVKRRLPPEIKQKLAKVARLAQASHGKISKELVNRLMSIVGHLIQLRTLKRNLKIMVNMGLSAKQEKDSRVQLVKKEVAEMIKIRIPLMKSKALELQGATSDDFQDISVQEKEAFKRKYSMDDLLEDKICDLYDLYVEGLEEDAGPQVRKLYAELSSLWPNGFMDNNGIKHAIYRAKDRRRPSYSRHKVQDPEKLKRKKMLAQKAGDNVRVENKAIAQQYIPEKPSDHGLAPVNKPNSSSAAASVAARMGASFVNGSSVDRLKQEKIKGSHSNSAEIQQGKDVTSTKKLRRKPEAMPGESQFQQEKVLSVQGDEKYKPQKQVVANSLSRSNLQPSAAASSFEQHS